MGKPKSPEELARIKRDYEGPESTEVIAARYGYKKAEGLRKLAYVHGWKRNKNHYRKGPPPTPIPDARRKDIEALWWSGDSTRIIARLMGVTPDTAYLACEREFGKRDSRLGKQIFYRRRNIQMYWLRHAGASVEDLADFYWLSPASVERILIQMRKEFGPFDKDRRETTIENAIKRMRKTEVKVYEKYERVFYQLVLAVAAYFRVQTQYVLMKYRGTRRMEMARLVCMYILNTEYDLSFKEVGVLMGKDRSTVSSAVRRVEDFREDAVFDADVFGLAELTEENVDKYIHFTAQFGRFLAAKPTGVPTCNADQNGVIC